MSHLIKEVKRRVLAPGPFAQWKHEASNQARPDLANLLPSARAGTAQCESLVAVVGGGLREDTRRVAFAIMQNLHPIVEAIDTDAGLYLGNAVEALRKVGADV
jgi:hypothetical protein